MQQDLAPSPTSRETPPERPGLWKRIQEWDGQLSVAKGFTLVTLLTGFFGGYFQYLNSYEDKVSELARSDMAAATSTFLEISNAFAEAQLLQQLIFFDFADSLSESADAGDKGMVTQAGNDSFPNYLRARTALRQNSSVFAHKAEIYIDWASDLERDPATQQALGADPLTEALLGDYDFDCDAPANFAPFAAAGNRADPAPVTTACSADTGDNASGQRTSLCARRPDTGDIDPNKPPITIDWQSAKHHLLTMHYCFEIAHAEIETARVWASKNDVGDDRIRKFRENQGKYKSSLNSQVVRLNALMSLAMSELERIRVKYRPSGFFCHVPLVRDAIGLFSTTCTPIRISARKSAAPPHS
jgi:hypothetical protein